MEMKYTTKSRNTLGYALLASTVVAFVCMLFSVTACDKGIVVEEDYSYEVKTLPYYDEVTVGSCVEIRSKIVAERSNDDTYYTLRYFPRKGKGKFMIGSPDTDALLPNDKYVILRDEEGAFRLYYRPTSIGNHTLLLTVENNMGREYPLEFKFNVIDQK